MSDNVTPIRPDIAIPAPKRKLARRIAGPKISIEGMQAALDDQREKLFSAMGILMPTNRAALYPPDTEDRLGSVAGSIRIAAKVLEDQPDDVMDRGLVDVLHLLQVIEKEVRAINHGSVKLQIRREGTAPAAGS